MKTYAFILGREYKLSLAEIIQQFKAYKMEHEIISLSEEMVVFSSDKIPQGFFQRLGGSIKYAEVKKVKQEKLKSEIEALVRKQMNAEMRSYFGFSYYRASDETSRNDLEDMQEEYSKFAFGLKKDLKSKQYSVRFVTSKDLDLSSVVVRKNKLLSEYGCDVIIGIGHKHFWVGRTLDVQDFEAFSARDFARPNRDDRSGMLPPKLARTMINLVGAVLTEKSILLDPFCGSGTVLQEAAILGAGKVLGSDISDKAIEDTEKNLHWVKQQLDIEFEHAIEQVDVLEIANWLPKGYVDFIVTEPYLGAPIRAKLSKGEIIDRQKELAEIYEKSLEQLAKVLKKHGILVIIFPFIGENRLPLPKKFTKNWEVLMTDPAMISSKRGGIDYLRPGQSVGREIMVLKKRI